MRSSTLLLAVLSGCGGPPSPMSEVHSLSSAQNVHLFVRCIAPGTCAGSAQPMLVVESNGCVLSGEVKATLNGVPMPNSSMGRVQSNPYCNTGLLGPSCGTQEACDPPTWHFPAPLPAGPAEIVLTDGTTTMRLHAPNLFDERRLTVVEPLGTQLHGGQKLRATWTPATEVLTDLRFELAGSGGAVVVWGPSTYNPDPNALEATLPQGTLTGTLSVSPSGAEKVDACEGAAGCGAELRQNLVLPGTFTLTP